MCLSITFLKFSLSFRDKNAFHRQKNCPFIGAKAVYPIHHILWARAFFSALSYSALMLSAASFPQMPMTAPSSGHFSANFSLRWIKLSAVPADMTANSLLPVLKQFFLPKVSISLMAKVRSCSVSPSPSRCGRDAYITPTDSLRPFASYPPHIPSKHFPFLIPVKMSLSSKYFSAAFRLSAYLFLLSDS